MRRYSANYVLPVTGKPVKNGIVEVDDNGVVVSLIEGDEEIHSTEFYNGVIVPGFVNAHCHLELSHMKGMFSKGLGLPKFVAEIGNLRQSSAEEIQQCISKSLFNSQNFGTVAIVDVCNNTDTLDQKQKSAIWFNNFVEFFDVDSNLAPAIFAKQMEVYGAFMGHFPSSTYVVPHAPYTVSDELWDSMNPNFGKCVSIHFAECLAEYDLIQHKKGIFYDRYTSQYPNYKVPSGGSPMGLVMQKIPQSCEVLLVHCTYASADELDRLNAYFKKVTIVTCPESNLFIEGQMANLPLLQQHGLRIAIGTDSLSSATTLSILYNINLILNKFPQIPFADVLKWATLNGAESLSIDSHFGSIEKGKKPGLNLITNFDFAEMRPTAKSEVKRLI